MKHNCKRFLSLLLALVMVVGLMPVVHSHAEETTYQKISEKVTALEENASYVIALAGSTKAMTNGDGRTDWGYHTMLLSDFGEYANAANIWTLEPADGGFKLKNVNGYLAISRNAGSLSETGHVFELVYTGDAGWTIKSLESNEYCNNLGGYNSCIGGWEGDGTKFDIYSLVEIPADEADPFGKLRGYWTKVSVDTETVYDAKEGLFEYAFDNNPGTIWHSNWQGASDKLTGENTFAGVIDFGAAYTITQFSFTPRQGNNSGQVTQASLYVKETEDAEWTLVAEHATFAADQSKKDMNFEAQAVRYVKFVAELSSDGWVAISEFDVAYNAPAVHEHSYEAVVTAPTCTVEGTIVYTCVCGDTYTETVPATGHGRTEVRDAKPATLLEGGYSGDEYCVDCGECLFTGESTAPLTLHNAQILGTGNVISLSDCEYTLTGDAENGYALCHDGTYYVKPAANGTKIPQTTTAYSSLILNWTTYDNNRVAIGDENGDLYFYKHSQEPTWDRYKGTHECISLYLLRADINSTFVDVPGYSVVTADDVQAGESYLIAVNADYGWYVMAPTDSATAADHVAMVVIADLTHVHNYEATVTAPTCTEGGYTTYTCACGDTYVADETKALGHNDGPIVVENEKPSTCTEGGYYDAVCYCTVCGVETYRYHIVVGPDGHFPTVFPGYPATCTEPGLTDGKRCGVCLEWIEHQEEIPALGHTPVVIPGTAADCENPGLTEGSYCSVCDKTLVAQEEIPALGHTPVVLPGTAADCENPGLTEGSYCSVCDKTLVAQEEIPALGHTPVVLPGTAADCENPGLTEGSYCSVCDKTLVAQEEIPATGHAFGDWTETKAPTCTEDGEEQRSCESCGKTETQAIELLGHEHELTEEVAPTCTEGGYCVYTCVVCGDSYVADETEALGHSYENGSCVNCGEADPDAVTEIANGWSGYTTWVLTSDGVLTVSPSGQLWNGKCNMANYYKVNGVLTLPWSAYADQIVKVVIEEGVHAVGQMAFYELPNLTEVVLPDSIEEIRNYAFKNTTALTTINLEVVETIREGAFYGCTGLENVTFAEGVVIEDWAFTKTTVVLP